MKQDQLVAVFDLDGTITKHDTYVHFLLFCLWSMPVRLLKSPMLVVYLLMYRAGFRTNHWLKARFLGLVVGGVDSEKLEKLSQKFHHRTLQGNIKQAALDEITCLRQQGYKVIIATASFSFYVSKIAESLGADELLCTTADVDEYGRLTGAIAGLNCIGEEKARRVERLLADKGWPDVQRAYSDHKVDLPLLKMSREALVVDPRPATEAVAVQYGYQILHWK